MLEFGRLGKASIPAVKQYLDLAIAMHLPVDDVLDALELTPELMADNDNSIPGEVFQQLIAELICLSDDPLYGLHTAKFVQPVSYSILGFIAMNCETLGQAMTKIHPFEKLVGDMGTTLIKEQNGIAQLAWYCRFDDPIVKRHMVDNCLASWLTFARFLVDKVMSPSKILLQRTKPIEKEQLLEYQSIFKCTVLFEQSVDAIVFDSQLLSLALKKGNKNILPPLESHAKILMASTEEALSTSAKVKIIIRESIPKGQFSMALIAEQLGVSGKTLQRKLKNEGLSFKGLVDEVRINRACELLVNLNLSIEEISFQIGFSEPKSFFRWFQNVKQITPGQYRKNTIR